MAFLMLLHEKMRLQRKQNKLTLKQLRNGNQLSRMESRIKKREKYYSKLEKQIDTQATVYKNMAKNYINMNFGTGANSWNPNSLFNGGGVGLTASAMQLMQQYVSKGISEDRLNVAISMGMGAFTVKTKLEDGKTVNDLDSNGKKQYECTALPGVTLTEDQYAELYTASQQIKTTSQQASMMAQQWQTEYENQVSIWVQAQKEELEMQQEWEMDLLAEEQADYEAEKESIAAELELVKQRKEAIEQELGQSIKDAAPKFGLA